MWQDNTVGSRTRRDRPYTNQIIVDQLRSWQSLLFHDFDRSYGLESLDTFSYPIFSRIQFFFHRLIIEIKRQIVYPHCTFNAKSDQDRYLDIDSYEIDI